MVWITGQTLSSTATSVTFSSIPQTFTHLQLRCFVRSDRVSVPSDNIYFRFNADAGNNYAFHYIEGNGGSVAAGGGASVSVMLGILPSSTATANSYGINMVDVLDYSSSNKNKTIRNLACFDLNGSGSASMWSGMWMNTAAITSFNVVANVGSFIAGSRFDLYGITSSSATGA
jgi:hypothetical protein